jgi:hypothetical protein
MLSQNPTATSQGVVIGYDGRHNSRKFAEITSGNTAPILSFPGLAPPILNDVII